jgi:translation initiation factor IF-3
MRISRHRRNYTVRQEEPRYRANEQITAPEVLVIGEEGGSLGVLPTAKAIATARERGFDLVEISPKANPPVAKILDFAQFKYEKQKEARLMKAHAKKVEVKGVRLSVRIGAHDLETRKKSALEFLTDGHKVQIEVVLRGREKAHADLARQVMETFAKSLSSPEMPVKVEQPFSKQGGRLTLLVARQ